MLPSKRSQTTLGILTFLCALMTGITAGESDFSQSCLSGKWDGFFTAFSKDATQFTVDDKGTITAGTSRGSFAVSGKLTLIDTMAGTGSGSFTFSDGSNSATFTVTFTLSRPGDGDKPNKMSGSGNGAGTSATFLFSGGTDCSNDPPPPPPPSPPSNKPDLIVSQINLSNEVPLAGQPIIATVTIQNTGTSAAGGFIVSLFLDQDSPIKGSAGAAASQNVSELASGSSMDIAVTLTYPAGGDHTLAVSVDAENNVAEANEFNNYHTQRITVLSKGQDLLILFIAKTESVPGLSAQFDLVIENRGTAAAGPFSVGFYANLLREPTAAQSTEEVKDFTGLEARGRLPITFILPLQNVPRAGRAWFQVDIAHSVAEDIESNNTVSVTWGVPNDPPTLISPITNMAGTLESNKPVTFSLTSSDPNGDPLSYLWDFGDGVMAQGGPVASHVYTTPGSYKVKCTISDGPFHELTTEGVFSVENDTWINLGNVSHNAFRGRVNLSIPIPPELDRRLRYKSKVIAGNPGDGVNYRNLRLRGKVSAKGEFRFTIEFFAPKQRVLKQLKFMYTATE